MPHDCPRKVGGGGLFVMLLTPKLCSAEWTPIPTNASTGEVGFLESAGRCTQEGKGATSLSLKGSRAQPEPAAVCVKKFQK